MEASSSDEQEVERLRSECKELERKKVETDERAAQQEEALANEQSRSTAALEHLEVVRKKEAELQSKIEMLQQALNDQRASVAAEGDEQVQHLQASLTELQLSYEDSNVKRHSLEQDIQRLRSEHKEIELKKTEADERAAQQELLAKEHLEVARKKEAELQSKIEMLQQSLNDQRAAVAAEGDEQVQHLQASLTELQLSYEESNVTRHSLEQDIQRLRSEHEEIELKKTEADERAAQQELLAKEHLEVARKKEAELQSKIEMLQQSLNDQRAAVAAEGDEQVQHLQASLTELQLSYEDSNVKRHSLEQDIQRLRSEHEEIELKKTEADERAAQHELLAKEHLEVARKKEAELQSKIEMLQQALNDQRASVAAEGDEQVQHLQASLTELQLSYEDSNVKRHSLEQDIQRLRSEHEEIELKKTEADERAAQQELLAKEHLEVARKKEAELQSKIEMLQQALNDQRASVAAEGDEQVQHLQASLTELQLSYEDSNVKRHSLEKEVQRLRSEQKELEIQKAEADERAAQYYELLAAKREEEMKIAERPSESIPPVVLGKAEELLADEGERQGLLQEVPWKVMFFGL